MKLGNFLISRVYNLIIFLISWVTNYAHNCGWFRLVYTGRQKPARVLYPTDRTNRLRVFLKAIFITTVLKNPHPLIVLIHVLRFPVASFNAVTSFIRDIFKPGRRLGTEMKDTLPIAIL